MDICEQCGMPTLVLYAGYCRSCDREDQGLQTEECAEESSNAYWTEHLAQLDWQEHLDYINRINEGLGLKETPSLKIAGPL